VPATIVPAPGRVHPAVLPRVARLATGDLALQPRVTSSCRIRAAPGEPRVLVQLESVISNLRDRLQDSDEDRNCGLQIAVETKILALRPSQSKRLVSRSTENRRHQDRDEEQRRLTKKTILVWPRDQRMTMGQRVTGHGSSGSTNLSGSRGSRVKKCDQLSSLLETVTSPVSAYGVDIKSVLPGGELATGDEVWRCPAD